MPCNLTFIIFANFIESVGFVIKALAESNLLYDCIPHSESRSKQFSKIDGHGCALFYIFDAISCVATGFLYAINPYIPMCLCLLFCLIATILSYCFKEIPKSKSPKEESTNLKDYLKGLKYSFRYILKSDRLKSLILFCGIFFGFINLLNSLRRSLLQDIGIEAQYLGIIFACMGIFAAVAADKENWFNKVFHNKFLACCAIILTFSAIFSGLAVIIPLPRAFVIGFVLLMFAIQHIIKGAYFTLNKKYLSSFSTSSLRTKIYSVNNMLEAICATITSFTCSFLLGYMSTAYATVILGCIFTLILLRILAYMKPRVGLKPEQYKRNDIPIEVQ